MATETETPTNVKGYTILETIQDVLEDRADNAGLAKALGEARTALQETESNYSSSWDRMDASVREACDTINQSAHGFFEQIRIALNWVEGYIKGEGNKDGLSTSANVIGRCNFQLNQLFVHLRNTAWALQGPTDIPTLNAMTWAHDDFVKDPTQTAAFRDLITLERNTLAGTVPDLDKGPQTPELEVLKQAFQKHGQDVERLAKALDAGSPDAVTVVFDEVRTNFLRLRDLIPAAAQSQRSAGPTENGRINAVLQLTDDVLADRIQEIVLINALEVVHHDYAMAVEEFKRLSARPSDSELVQQEMKKVEEAYALQKHAFDQYAQYFQGRLVHRLQEARETMEEAAIELDTCFATLQEISSREGKTLCIRCGEYNPNDRQRCQNCGMQLASIPTGHTSSTFQTREGEPPTQEDGPILTGNMVRLYNAVNGLADGSLTAAQYTAELDWFQGVIEASEHFNKEPDFDSMSEEERAYHEEIAERMKEAEPLFNEAIDEYHQAIELFRQYGEAQDAPVLERAVRLADGAARKMVTIRDIPTQVPQPAAEA